MDDKEKTVGAILKEARLAKGISLADAEKATSIRSRYLQAVENDEYDKTPGEVFLKGIIRNYGNYLGLNGPELVNEYKASAAGMAAEAVRSQGIREVEKVRLNIQLKDKRDIGSGTGRFEMPGLPKLPMKQCLAGLAAVAVLTAGYFAIPATIDYFKNMPKDEAKQTEQVRREADREKMYADLLRAVSHDIRTPLTGIVGATNVLLEQDGGLTQEQRQQLLRSTNEDAQWLIRIVENLLSITRISSEEAKVKKEPEPAEEVIESAVAKTHKHYPEVDIRVHLPDELMMVPMDPLLMEQVLVNLMENAVIHGETHHIDVTLSSEGNCAVFTVADDGRGIPQHLLPRLFDGSARSDRSSDGKRSMGIGLSVCRTIVLAHGGVIRGDNRQEGGAVFTVTLPMKGENDED